MIAPLRPSMNPIEKYKPLVTKSSKHLSFTQSSNHTDIWTGTRISVNNIALNATGMNLLSVLRGLHTDRKGSFKGWYISKYIADVH